MKLFSLAVSAVCLIGCSGGGGENKSSPGTETIGDAMSSGTQQETPSKKDEMATAPTEKKQFEDDIFKVPVYPGAREVPNTRLIMDSDVAESYNCTFQTNDDPDKVADFYKAEGAKVGKIVDLPLGQKPGTGLRVVAVEVSKNEKIQIQATKSAKEGTMFSVHYVTQKH